MNIVWKFYSGCAQKNRLDPIVNLIHHIMQISSCQIILYVAHQRQSTKFYSEILGKQPCLDVPGMTEFIVSENLKLGLMPEAGIAKILSDKTPHPATGNGIPRCELYIYTNDIYMVFQQAKDAGAREISSIQKREWDDTVGYLADLDGHILAFAVKNQEQ